MEEVLMKMKPAWPDKDKRHVPWGKTMSGDVRFTAKQALEAL
jgi:hypothetical protein